MNEPTIRRPRLRGRRTLIVFALAGLWIAATESAAAQGGSRSTPPTGRRPVKPVATAKTPDSAVVKPAPAAAPAMPLATVTGTVYDSVHVGPLRRAAVLVEGTSRVGFTSDEGRYRVDSIPPGPHRLHVDHPLLDSLGLNFQTEEFTLGENDAKILDLAIPSSETLVALSCPAARRALGPSAIIGRLLDADTDTPVEGVRVTFAWTQISLTAGLRRSALLRDAITGADGVFRICGLPNQVEGTLQAEKKGISTSELTLRFEGQPLVVQGLRIGNAQTVARSTDTVRTQTKDSTQRLSQVVYQRGQAVLVGRVVSANGQAVRNARVDVRGTLSADTTNSNGEFRLTELPSGTQTVVARQIGFAPVEQAVELTTRAPANIVITMSKPAQVLAPVVVQARQADGLEKIGFTQRKRGSAGGYFVTGDEVMKRAPNVLTDVFRTIPMLRVTPGGPYGTDYVVEDARNPGLASSCVRYVIDNTPYKAIYPGDIDRMIPPWEIGGIEIYHGSQVPLQFSQAGESSCVVIVIWSKNNVENAARRKR